MCEYNNEIEQWLEKYGTVTSYSFMIYGPMSIRDNAIINKGLTLTMLSHDIDVRYVQITEEVDAEEAEAFGTYRGWNVQWVFAGTVDEEIIPNTIKEGLEHLRLNYEYYGQFGDKPHV